VWKDSLLGDMHISKEGRSLGNNPCLFIG